jgi:ribosomal protein S18 acetylase RimI-like enzyme
MRIRLLTSSDAIIFQELRLYALQESPSAFGSSYAEEVGRPLEVVAERLGDEDNHVFGAFTEDGRLVGEAILRWEKREKNDHKAFVFGMFVLPEYREQGVGRALLEAVVSRASELGIRQVNLTVNNSNEAAVQLYESCDFERFGLEKDAFRIGDDFCDVAYMSLRLRGIG